MLCLYQNWRWLPTATLKLIFYFVLHKLHYWECKQKLTNQNNFDFISIGQLLPEHVNLKKSKMAASYHLNVVTIFCKRYQLKHRQTKSEQYDFDLRLIGQWLQEMWSFQRSKQAIRCHLEYPKFPKFTGWHTSDSKWAYTNVKCIENNYSLQNCKVDILQPN